MESATTTTSGNKRENLRWIILMLNCILLIGNYYAYDLPSALAPLLRPHLNQSNADFDYLIGLFYSVYSFPNIILPFISGHLIEVVGVKHVLIWLSVCVCLGQLLFFVGCMQKNIALMIAGRLVFGLCTWPESCRAP
jgi:MFS family permease